MISLDLETTGLDERVHEAWEIGMVCMDTAVEYLYELPVRNLALAQPEALAVNRYYDRSCVLPGSSTGHSTTNGHFREIAPEGMAHEIAAILGGRTLMGCAVSFDMRFLAALLRTYGEEPSWHHRSLDLGSYAAGVLGAEDPYPSGALAREFVPNDEAHTALGDARWNVKVYKFLRERAG